MALAASVASEYLRQAGQQQVLYSYWRSAGDVARARLALDVSNWYFQQIGIPFYYPTDFIGYVPSPTSPDTAVAIGATLTTATNIPAIGGGSSPAPGADSTSTDGLQANYTDPFGGGYGPSSLNDYCAWFPDDPICWGSGSCFDASCGGGGGGGPIYSGPVTIVINQQGLTLADVASKISGALATAAAAIATAVDTVLGTAIAGIQHAINAIGNQLVSVFHLLARLSGFILQFLKGLLLDVVKGLVAAVRAIGEVLKNVIQGGLIPALQALGKLRDYLVKIYERFLRPLLIVLQDIRKVLAILKVFHIGFATKLDAVLADIQSKISTPLLYLLRFTNTIANYINLILDARLFIQRPLFLASANANKGSLLNLLINAMNPTPDPAAIAAQQAKAVIPTPAQSQGQLQDFLASGGGSMATSIAQNSADLQRYLQQGL